MTLCLFCLAMAALGTATAEAAQYKMVACASTNGTAPYTTATNTTSAQNPGGIFEFGNYCGGQGGDPPGQSAFLRIVENQSSGFAGNGAYGEFIFDAPPYVRFKAAGGYTRQPNAFNDGWRARFWILDFGYVGTQLLTQGAGLPNSGTQSPSSNIFGPHFWPFGNYIDFHRFVYELQCVRPAGCDRSNYNATDANGFVFILSDDSDSQVALANTSSSLLRGEWVTGAHEVDWNSSDFGSGLRVERLRIDGAERFIVDYQAAGRCDLSGSQVNGEWARTYQPCPTGGPFARAWVLDTASLADGAHSLSVCTQDYGQYQGLNGTGGETCDQRTVHVDNTAPGAPTGLFVASANPARYLDRFDAHFSLPPNQGSPIAAVHYDVINAAGEVVKAEQVLTGMNPTELADIAGPAQPGEYRLRVWLEDSVGLSGPAALAPIPHDTTPPAAPQIVSVTAPDVARGPQGFDVLWRNLPDNGSPINAARYQVLNSAGAVVVPTQVVGGEDIQSIADLLTPTERGSYTLRLWLADAEGNVGAPVSAPLAYDCVRSEARGGTSLSAGLGSGRAAAALVEEGQGSVLSGVLSGAGGGVANAPLCIYSNVVTDEGRSFLGIAVTGAGGEYQFAIAAGPSRHLRVLYRPDQRQLSARATLQTRVHPTLTLKRKLVHNKHYARFYGEIPGPNNDNVVVVLQVQSGKGWRVFRRYRTRSGGHFDLRYRFSRTATPTTYVMRAQVRGAPGYPYERGNSRQLALRVLP